MRKGLAYVELAEKCRQLASAVTDPLHKKQQLQGMARSWETVATERAKQLAKPSRSKRARKSK
jgi:hypothetical protein